MIDDIFEHYQLCLSIVQDIADEVKKDQIRLPLIPAAEIIELHFDIAQRFGWGCVPGEVEWIFRNVAQELNCEIPALFPRNLGYI